MKRIKSGIPGLDQLLGGGIPKGDSILLAGGPGTGKTVFCEQFIWKGLQQDEQCAYVTFEELPQELTRRAKRLGMNFDKYKDKLELIYRFPFKREDLDSFEDEVRRGKIKRAVLDSTSVLMLSFRNQFDLRKYLYELINVLKAAAATSFLTSESPEPTKLSRFGVEEYVADGVIRLWQKGKDRFLEILKLSGASHRRGKFSFEITEQGAIVKS